MSESLTTDDIELYSTSDLLSAARSALKLDQNQPLQETFIDCYCKHNDANRTDPNVALKIADEIRIFQEKKKLPYFVTRQALDYYRNQQAV